MAIISINSALVSNAEDKNILLLDTDMEFLLELERYLRMKGYSTKHIATLGDAENFQPPFSPNVILCSIAFAPYLHEIKQKIRELTTAPAPKVLILSNHGSMEDIRYAMKLGAEDCISKTVSSEFIVFAFEAILNRQDT